MSLQGGGESGGVNPNVDVGGEGKVEQQAGEAMSFDDLDQPDFDAEKGKRKAAKPEKRESVKNDDPKDKEKADAKDGKEKPAKDAKDSKADAAKPKEGDKPEEKPEDGKAPKAKKHKFQHGETAGELQGDAVFTIPVNGVKESVALQDLVNEYNGKKFYENQHKTLTSDRDKFVRERDELTSVVKDFSERASKDPDDAWDFLAEMNGGDPIAFKEGMLRKNIESMKPLMEMDANQLEAWINQRKLEWRDKLVTKRENRIKNQTDSIQQTQARSEIQQTHGLSDDDFQKHHAGVKQYLGGKEPTPDQVVYASKLVSVQDAMKKATPGLVNHPERAKIVQELAAEMMNDPKMTQAAVEATLKHVFGGEDDDGNESLRRAARNAKKNASPDADERSGSASGKKPKHGYESFDDLD